MHGRTDSSMAKAMVGTVGGGESPCWSVLQAGSCVAVTAWCPVLCVTQLFDKRAIVLPSKGESHQSAWLGVPPERAGWENSRVFPSLG